MDTLPKDKLEQLKDRIDEYKFCQKEIERAEQKLKEFNKKLNKVSREDIPLILNEIGLSDIRLQSGEKIEIEDKVKASITKENILKAFKEMVKAEGGTPEAEEKIESLFKTELVVVEDISDEILDILLEQEVSYNMKKSIHPQTLSKYCRQKLDAGKNIPEGISVYTYQETKIK